MDTIDDSLRESVFEDKKSIFEKNIQNFELNFFQTSIWELNFYKIFCQIFSNYFKDSQKIQRFLEDYASTLNAEEVLLFNKKTSLFISSYSNKEIKNEKIEKICYSLKKLARKLKKSENKFKEMTIRNKMNTILVSEFNEYCYLVIILPKDSNELQLAKLNKNIGKILFENNIN